MDTWTVSKGAFEVGTGGQGSLEAKIQVREAVSVTVSFKKAPKKFDVSFSIEGDKNGKLIAESDGISFTEESPISVEKDKIVILRALPNNLYEVDSWNLSTGSFIEETGKTNMDIAKVRVQGNVNITLRFKAFDNLPETKEYSVNGIKFTMRVIEAVNANLGWKGIKDNPIHSMKLSEYQIGETQVTQELWEAVMNENPSYFESGADNGEEQGKRPVEHINWYECVAFCNELTKKVFGGDSKCIYYNELNEVYTVADAKGKKPVKGQSHALGGFRLPTEAEWEWAAKGGRKHEYCNTDSVKNIALYGWFSINSHSKTHEVKKKNANGYGLYDMTGNVWEWCYDWYGENIPSGGNNYKGPNFGTYRILRGGTWSTNATDDLRIANRDYGWPDDNDGNDAGLRIVRNKGI